MQWSDIVLLLALPKEEKISRHVTFSTGIASHFLLAEQLCQLANNQGGQMVIGIDIRNNHLIGTAITAADIQQLCSQFIDPPLAIETESVRHHDRNVVVCTVGVSPLQSHFVKSNLIPVDFQSSQIVLKTAAQDPVISKQAPALQITEPVKETPSVVTRAGAVTHNAISVRHFISTEGARKRQEHALKILKSKGLLTNREYRQLFHVSHKTAHLELMDMVAHHQLTARGAGRSACYEYPGWIPEASQTPSVEPTVAAPEAVPVEQNVASTTEKPVATREETIVTEKSSFRYRGFDPFAALEATALQNVDILEKVPAAETTHQEPSSPASAALEPSLENTKKPPVKSAKDSQQTDLLEFVSKEYF